MTRRVPDLPEALVGKHLQEVLDSCQETDTRSSVLMLARRLGLTDTTIHGNLVTRRSRPASDPRRGVSPRSPSPASRRPRCPDVRRGWRTGRRCGPPLAGR
ncbi:hypothetical protein ABID95_001154 [Streptomyces atratus]